MASQAALACTGGPGKSDSGSPVPAPPSGLVVGRKECAARATSTCPASHSTSFYRRLKRRLGRSLRRGYSKRRLVRTRKSPPYQLSRAETVFLALKSFEHLCRDQVVLIATDNTTVVAYINKQGGMRSGSLCALLWRLLA